MGKNICYWSAVKIKTLARTIVSKVTVRARQTQFAGNLLEAEQRLGHIQRARAHGLWTYEPRQGRKAATVVCSVSAVVTLAFFNSK